MSDMNRNEDFNNEGGLSIPGGSVVMTGNENELDDDVDSVDAYLSNLPATKETNENEECKQQQSKSSDDIASDDHTELQITTTNVRRKSRPSSSSSDSASSDLTAQVAPANNKARKPRIMKMDEEKTDEQKLREILSRDGVLKSRGCNYDDSTFDWAFSHDHRNLLKAIFCSVPLNLNEAGQVIYRHIPIKHPYYTILYLLH